MVKISLKAHGHLLKTLLILGVSMGFIISAFLLVWVSTFKVPTSESIRERRVTESTKIYDKTGKVLLYDTGGNVRRSIVPIEEISRHIKNATIAIEDTEFYNHIGVCRANLATIYLVWFLLGISMLPVGQINLSQQFVFFLH
jgi:penicillin-binding protein 1A